MATKRQIEEQDRASEQRRTEAVGAIIAVQGAPTADEKTVAIETLGALAEALNAEAVDVTELRRKGWQTMSKEYFTAAKMVSMWRDLLVEYTPPAGMPTREPAEIARDHRADTPADLEQRLVEAFGPELAPVRHIRTVVEEEYLRDGDTAANGDGAMSTLTYGPLCNATTGSFTHPGGANCEECHRIHAEQQGQPYTGPTSGMDVVRTIETVIGGPEEGVSLVEPSPLIEAAAELKTWQDGPVTPEVARAMREAGPFTDEVKIFELPEMVRSEIERTGMDQDAAMRIITDAATTGKASATPTIPSAVSANDQFGVLAPEPAHDMDQGDAVSVTLPDGEVVTGTARNVVTAGTETTADLVGVLHIVEPTAPAVRPRMSAAQVREHAMRRASGAEHRSISQVEGFSDCGTRYALRDLERPAWWNVGGKALHRAVETINRYTAERVPGAISMSSGISFQDFELDGLFLRAFDAEIADQHAATPEHPMSTWRAAKRGAEHYDWWRVEGPIMVQRWVAWLSRMLADGWTIATGAATGGYPFGPVIEFETRLDVGIAVPNLSIIDLALLNQQQNVLLIVDCKAGGSAPKDTFQLGVYGWSLLAAGVAGFTPAPDLSNVRGAYWRARTGETAPNIVGDPSSQGWPVLQVHPWPDVVQRYRDMDTMERQGVYMPNVTSFCGGCGVADLCPAKATT